MFSQSALGSQWRPLLINPQQPLNIFVICEWIPSFLALSLLRHSLSFYRCVAVVEKAPFHVHSDVFLVVYFRILTSIDLGVAVLAGLGPSVLRTYSMPSSFRPIASPRSVFIRFSTKQTTEVPSIP